MAYDYIAEDPANLIFFPVTGYNVADLEVTRSMLTDDATVLGLSDGGAHCSSILDAGMPTWMLIHWVRDRSRGPRLPLEFVVKRQTSETARFFGLNDRGVLEVGKKADVNVLDFNHLRVQKPEVVYDLPAGGRRLVQQAEGYKATFVSGVPVFENGEHTGALPGRLVRAGK
ncbi:amidohydrolase family protein [Siccirubricoccus deserti]